MPHIKAIWQTEGTPYSTEHRNIEIQQFKHMHFDFKTNQITIDMTNV